MRKPVLLFAMLAFAISPAAAQTGIFKAEDFLTAAGLTPRSGVKDAARRYGAGKAMEPGIEFLVPGSSAEPWLTFSPGETVYVDCDEAPVALPDDSVGRLCRIAQGADWEKALAALQQALSAGIPTPGMKANAGGEREEQAEHAPGAANDQDEDDNFTEVVRTFKARGYSIQVAACPRIRTRNGGTWHAGVMVNWKRL